MKGNPLKGLRTKPLTSFESLSLGAGGLPFVIKVGPVLGSLYVSDSRWRSLLSF